MNNNLNPGSAGGRGPSRQHSLTSHTRQAFCQTLEGLISLAIDLLSVHGFAYVLLGQFQSDKLEGEFGVYRQSSGGCYFISVEQLLCSARFRRMQLYANIFEDVEIPAHTDGVCCASCLTEEETELLDNCPEAVDSITPEEHGAIYYVCGYVARKDGLGSRSSSWEHEHSHFTDLVSRGLLSHPPHWLFVFGQFCYGYFQMSNIRCVTRLSAAFSLVHETFFDVPIEVHCLSSITRRLSNCMLKGLVRRDTEALIPSLPSNRQLSKLRSSC